MAYRTTNKDKLEDQRIPEVSRSLLVNPGYRKANANSRVRKTNMELATLKEYGVTLKQELFCQYYTSPSEYFGNGVQSYVAAHNVDVTQKGSYMMAKSRASTLLTMPHMIKRIDSLLKDVVLNDVHVDKQLSFLITQNADFATKLGAIKEYNKLRNRITEKYEHTVVQPITEIIITDAEFTDNSNEDTDTD